MALGQLQEDIKISGIYSMLHESELEFLFKQTSSPDLPGGAILCAGVWKGGDIVIINQGLRASRRQREIIAIDSFEGVSDPHEYDLTTTNPVMKGQLSPNGISEFDKTMDLFKVKNLHIYKLWITEDSISFIGERKLALIWLDLDHYYPTIVCMKQFYPWLSKDGLMLVHDYAYCQTPGVRKAANEFGGNWFHCTGGIWGLRKEKEGL